MPFQVETHGEETQGTSKALKKEPRSLNHHMEESYLPIRSTVLESKKIKYSIVVEPLYIWGIFVTADFKIS